MVSRPRVLFFDYWTKGFYHFHKLAQTAPSRAADYLLFHLGSYRDPKVPPIEMIAGIPCVDVKAFKGMSLQAILKSLRPDVVLSLNVNTLFDRALYLTCARLGVPTIFVQHGSWAEMDQVKEYCKIADRGFTVMDRVRRIPAYVRIIPWYWQARSNKWDLTPLKVIQSINRAPTTSQQFCPVAPEELWPTNALVFNEGSAERLVQTHRIPRERIHVVGNPELDEVVARRRSPLSPDVRDQLLDMLGLTVREPVLCYIEDGFVEQQNYFGWTEHVRIHLLKELSGICRRAGVQVLVRPHPSTNSKPMVEAFRGQQGIVISRACNLTDAIDLSSVALGTVSTALEVAVILGKPVLIPGWHIQNRVEFSPYLKYHMAELVATPEQLFAAISKSVNRKGSSVDISELAQKRLGPVDGKAAQRMITTILEIATAHRARIID